MSSFLSPAVQRGTVLASTAAFAALLAKRVLSGAAKRGPHKAEKKEFHRLPEDVRPTHYDLLLEPDMRSGDGATYSFSGTVTITLTVARPTREIKLNVCDLKLHEATVIDAHGANHEGHITVSVEEQVATIRLAQELKAGTAFLTIAYTGDLNDKLKGFYRSNYTINGQKKILACTQFEPTEARRALPCWDEPAVKATFAVTMRVPSNLKALSNTPIIKSTPAENNLVEHTFAKTPIMSTYLLAFVVGEFDYLEATDANGIIIRCYTPVGQAEHGRFGLEAAVKILPFYTKYFEIPYPLPKLDMIAIPDFSAGAMENWGLVTYRETALLLDPNNPSNHGKQYVGLVVAHELAHQWFGNLVTMEWWTHLWLNEGFATWIEYLAVDYVFPEWKIWEQFVSIDLGRSLNLDGLENSHPVEVDVHHPDEIDEIFDAISYSKGSCVIRMLVSYLNEEPFRKGMVKYLNKFIWSNAFTQDLWQTLEQHTGKPVEKVMSTWTKQTGYPVVEVASTEINGEFNLVQKRFLSKGPVAAKDDTQLWAVPITARIAVKGEAKAQERHLLLDRKHDLLVLPSKLADRIEWVKLNADQTGHYRVLYPQTMIANLVEAIKNQDPRLTGSDRLGVVSDAFALTRANLMPVEQLLDIISAYANETDYTVWSDLSAQLASLSGLLKFSDQYAEWNKYVAQLYANAFNLVGWEAKPGESHLTAMLRTVVIARLVGLNYRPAVEESLRRFDKFSANLDTELKPDAKSSTLEPDLRGVCYVAVIRERGQAGYDAVMRIYNAATLNEEKVRCLRAFAAGNDPAVIKSALEFVFSDKVRSQDGFMGLLTALDNRHGAQIAWEYLKANWDTLVKRFGGSFIISRMVAGLQTFTTEDKANEISQFFKTHPAPAAERAVLQSVEKIRSNAEFVRRAEPAVRARFAVAK